MCQQILVKHHNIKFHENPLLSHTDRQTDREKQIGTFLQILVAKKPKNLTPKGTLAPTVPVKFL
jgi:hypothetical protein